MIRRVGFAAGPSPIGLHHGEQDALGKAEGYDPMLPVVPARVRSFHCRSVKAQSRAARERARFLSARLARLVGCSALLGSPPPPRTARAVFNTPRSASSTAASVGKASTISGSMRTMFVPSRKRFAYLPRTPPFIEAKSYSGRSSSVAVLSAFFIKCTLAPCRKSGADNSDGLVLLGVRNEPIRALEPRRRS